MAKQLYDKEIDKNVNWNGDETTGGLQVKGNRVQEFIKKTFEAKAGYFYYDTNNNRYLVFADEQTKNEYLENPDKTDLILGAFDAPFNYTAEINLSSPTYVAILLGKTNNYIDFTFDVKNKQGASTGEDVVCTYTFIRNSVKKVVTQTYRYGTSVHFNIDEYLGEGTNTITVNILGKNTLAGTSVAITYQVVNLHLSDNMDISKVYDLKEASVLEVPFTVSGYGTKTVEWFIDGEQLPFNKNEDEVVEVSATKTKYITLSNELPEGKHNLQFKVYSIVQGSKFYSQTLYRDFIVYKGEGTKPIIAVAAELESTEEIKTDLNLEAIQYIPLDIPIAVFSPNGAAATVDILLDDAKKESISVSNREVVVYSLIVSDFGSKTVKIKCGDVEYSIPIEIGKSDTTLAEITESLILDLRASGKSNSSVDKDVWKFGDYTTEFTGFNWNKNSGWDSNRLMITKGASIDINIAPLSNDATDKGKTLEFEFSTMNVKDNEEVVCDLMNSSGTGLKITASELVLQSSQKAKVTTKFKSEENIRIAIVINKKQGVSNKKLVFIYINGIISGAINYSDTDNFISDKMLSFASNENVEIALKSLRFYDTALSSDQILNNYILYRDNVTEMMRLYDKNNIYSEGTTNFSPDILAGQLPVMIVTGPIPELENTTDKNKEIVVDVEYTNLQDPTRSFKMTNAIMRPQGTSSMSYPKKNFRLYTKRREDTVLYDANGNIVEDKLYSFKEGAQPVKTWCMKADYAESSGTHNTGIARLWNDVMKNAIIDGEFKCRTNAQKAAVDNKYPYDVRTTVDGFPILMFYRLTKDDDLIFIGKYNFNNDKSTESVFGFKDIPGFDNAKMQCWEVLNNGNHLALFQDVENFDEEWKDAFEARYPDDGDDADVTDLKAFAEWLVSTKDDPEKFKTEKADHIDLYKMAAYYVYIMRFGAVDQTVKNAMFTSEDGQHWYYINYDNDTILGVRNDGLLIYDPYIDRQTLDSTYQGEVYCYAGHDSTLWNNLEADEEFMKIVETVDQALYSAGLSYKSTIEMFDDKQSSIWPERVYNQDAQYKYIGPFVDSGVNNIYMLQGARRAHRRWWLSQRFNFIDSKFISGDYKANNFTINLGGAPIGIEFSIEAGSSGFYGYGVNNEPVEVKIPLELEESHTFTTKQVLNVGDPLRIYSAPNLQSIDIHNFIEYVSAVRMEKVYSDVLGTRLKKLILGVDTKSDLRRNTSLTTISGITSAKSLEYLDISGFKSITNLDLSGFFNLNTLKAYQSGLADVTLAEGSRLTLLELPETLAALSLRSCTVEAANVLFEDVNSVKIFNIQNCSGFVTNYQFFVDWAKNKKGNPLECSLTLYGINWTNISGDDLLAVGKIKQDGGKLDLKGKIRLESATAELVSSLKDIFGENCFNPDSELYISAPDAVYVTGPSEVASGDTVQYTAVVFSEHIGTVEYSITSGGSANITIDSETGVLTTKEQTSTSNINIRVIHRPTQGVPVQENLSVKVVPRIYPTISFNESGIIDTDSKDFTLKFSPEEYNGIFTLEYSGTGDAFEQGYLEITNTTNKGCRVSSLKEPAVEGVSGTLNVKRVRTFDKNTQTFSLEITYTIEGVIMTATSNPEVFAVCKEQGWCLNENYMTKEEAEAVEDIGTAFKSKKIKTFEEFKYFTKITTLKDSFSGCSELLSIELPESINTVIKGSVGIFYSCSKLQNVVGLENTKITSLYKGDFYGCKALAYVKLPETITSIEYRTFEMCTALQRFELSPDNEFLGVVDNIYLYNKKTKELLSVAPYLRTDLVIPNEVQIISESCCAYFRDVISVTLHSSISKIKRQAFAGCSKLQSLINLENSGITYIEEQAFESCDLGPSLTFPQSLTNIGDRSFYFNKNLISLHLENTHLYGVSGSFTYCKALEEVFLPESITYLSNSFTSCSSLKEISIPKGVTYISGQVFYECTALKTIKCYSPSISTTSGNFGVSASSYTGRNTYNTGENKLIVPENATGYDRGEWLDTLCNSEKCGFTLEKTLPAVETMETMETLAAKNTMLMSFARMAINTMSLPTEAALEYKEIYPTWGPDLWGMEVDSPFKFNYQDDLYEVLKKHTISKEWVPGASTRSLYKVVNKDPEQGTLDNPIIWSKGMELEEGKYYKDKEVTYKCIRSSGIPLEYDLADLISGGYVEPV